MPEPGVRLAQVDSIPLAVIRRVARRAELSTVVPRDCGTVWSVLRAQGVKGGRHVALYLDDRITLEVGVEMETSFVDSGLVVHSATPAGPAAIATHFGPYAGLHEAHAAIARWCVREGRALAGPSWEIYGHWEPAWATDPSRIRTDVVYALTAPRAGEDR